MPTSHDATNKALVLAAVCAAGLMMPLSFTGPAVATPAIGRELGGSPVALGWIVNAFILSFGSAVMSAGALADQLGRKRVFRAGVACFAGISIVLGLAPNVLVLDLLRAAQGVSAAFAMSAGAASLAQEFEGAARTRAYSLLGTTFGVGLAFGPIWSGFLVETFGWRSVFFTGAVIGLLVLGFGVPRLRETRDPGADGTDWAGAATFTAALLLLTLGIVQAPESGWGDPRVVGLLVGAALVLASFVVVERRVRRPMLDLTLFRYTRFVGAQLLPISTAFSFVVLLVLLPIRFIGVEGYSEIGAGLLMLPLCAPMVVVPFVASVLARRFPSSVVSAFGLGIAACGIVWLSTVHPGGGAMAFFAPTFVVGLGTGLPWGLMDDLAVSVVPKERAGMATGIFATMRLAGEGIALAIVRAALVALTQRELRTSLVAEDAGTAAQIPALANEIAAGSLERASASLPYLTREAAMRVYGEAFRVLCYGLAAMTLASAVAAFVLLRHPGRRTSASYSHLGASSPTPVARPK